MNRFSVGDLGPQEQPPKLGQAFEVNQPSVGHVGEKQIQRFEFGQMFEVNQPSIRHFGSPQAQRLEPGRAFEVNQPSVGDLRCPKTQRLKLSQSFQVCQPSVGDGSLKAQPFELGDSFPLNSAQRPYAGAPTVSILSSLRAQCQ